MDYNVFGCNQSHTVRSPDDLLSIYKWKIAVLRIVRCAVCVCVRLVGRKRLICESLRQFVRSNNAHWSQSPQISVSMWLQFKYLISSHFSRADIFWRAVQFNGSNRSLIRPHKEIYWIFDLSQLFEGRQSKSTWAVVSCLALYEKKVRRSSACLWWMSI